MRLAVCLLAAIPWVAEAQSRLSPDDADRLQRGLIVAADVFVLPAYRAQSEAAGDLVDALDTVCTAAGDIADAREAFAETFLSWQRASIIQTGPVMAAEGPMRVQLWPDPKGFSSRATRAALNAEDPSLLEEGGLVGRSIALTSLTALEGLIYGSDDLDGYACSLAHAIARFQADLAAELVVAWSPASAFRSDYDTALDGNTRYASVDALVREVVGGMVVYTDRLRKFKLLRGIGAAQGDARPKRTEAHTSGLGLASLEVSFRTLAEVYGLPSGLFGTASEISGSREHHILGETATSVADSIALQTESLAAIAEEDGSAAAQLRNYAELVLYQEAFLKAGFARSIGLTSGFTSADGD